MSKLLRSPRGAGIPIPVDIFMGLTTKDVQETIMQFLFLGREYVRTVLVIAPLAVGSVLRLVREIGTKRPVVLSICSTETFLCSPDGSPALKASGSMIDTSMPRLLTRAEPFTGLP